MAVIGTFGSFTTARMGIYASMAAMNVTGNNISNINTKGYTRQRVDLASLYSGGADRYANDFNTGIGYGVLVDGVSQLRDPYLDIRYRNEQASVGMTEYHLDGLKQLASNLDEVGRGPDDFGIVERQMSDFLSQLEYLHRNVGTEEYETLVRSSADTLTKLLNSYSQAMDTVSDDIHASLKEDIKSINNIFSNIRSLNEQIRNAGIHGNKALELRDMRNNYIDELSKFMKIDVTYSMEEIDQYNSVEKLTISLADTGNPPIVLVDGVYATELQMPEQLAQLNPDYDPDDAETDGKGKYLLDPNDPDYNDGADATRPVKTTTNDITKAMLETADGKPGSDAKMNDKLLMELAPLVDAKGRYMRDENGREITETVRLGDTTLYGSIQAKRETLTEKGEFSSEEDQAMDPDACIKRGIPYYKKALDAVAYKFASEMNKANVMDPKLIYQTDPKDPTVDPGNTFFLDANGDPVTRPDGSKIAVSDMELGKNLTLAERDAQTAKIASDLVILQEKGALKPEYAFYDGGVLFSNSSDNNDPSGITAGNISVSKNWSARASHILTSREPGKLVEGQYVFPTTANDNVDHMIVIMRTKLDYIPRDVDENAASDERYFHGTFQEMFTNISGTLAADTDKTTIVYNNYYATALDLDNDRASVSGVDLNEEATNMMQYQKSYSASCRLLTTIDSMLDKLINGTAI